jgi:hypothetical protein
VIQELGGTIHESGPVAEHDLADTASYERVDALVREKMSDPTPGKRPLAPGPCRIENRSGESSGPETMRQIG